MRTCVPSSSAAWEEKNPISASVPGSVLLQNVLLVYSFELSSTDR